jgi:hypothetical protein
MTQLKIDESTARALYPTADPGLKAILDCTFGQEAFKVKKSFDQILTIDDVFEATGADRTDPKYHQGAPDEIAYHLLKLLPLALNPVGWKPDYNDDNQRKWSPWFYMDSPGFRFDDSLYGLTGAGSTGGSRLCYASEKISDHAGRTFVKLYEQFLA